jgi:hypothetical protein
MWVTRVLAVFLAFLLAQPGQAQTTASDRIKSQVSTFPTGGKVTVNMLDGAQYCGTVASIDPESLTVHEVDLQKELILRYEQIQRVRKDYGRKGFGGRRVHPRTNRIAGLVILGVLLGVVIAAVIADKS